MTPIEFVQAQKGGITAAVALAAKVCCVSEDCVWKWLAGQRKWKPSHEILLQVFAECSAEQRVTWWPQL